MSASFGKRTEGVQVRAGVKRTGSDKRFAGRRKAETPGYVYLEGSNAVIGCVVRDVSTTGAKVEVQENWKSLVGATRHLPQHLTLVIRHDRVAYDCKIVRHDDRLFGLRFLAAPRPIPKKR